MKKARLRWRLEIWSAEARKTPCGLPILKGWNPIGRDMPSHAWAMDDLLDYEQQHPKTPARIIRSYESVSEAFDRLLAIQDPEGYERFSKRRAAQRAVE